jgi:tol-pal system protein YbgF
MMNKSLMLVPLLFSLAACATRGEINLAQQEIEDIKIRLTYAEKTVSATKQEALEIAEKSSRDALKNLEILRRGTADMQANLDAMRIDVQVMAGKVDDLGLAAKKPFEDISLLKEDTSKAVQAMEERLTKLEQSFYENNAKMLAIAKALEAPPTPDALYKQAQESLKAGDTKKARETLNKLLEQFPNHKLSPNARYWIGETYYLEKNYEQAVLEFQRVIKEFPGKDKVPAAMLKQAMAFRELGDLKSAKFVLKELLDKAPHSEEAQLGRDLLSKLK